MAESKLTHDEDKAWNITVADWRRTGKKLPWAEIPSVDLSDFIRSTPIPLLSVSSITDIGSCDGSRIMHACMSIPELNRSDVRVHCIDVCESSIEMGRHRWQLRNVTQSTSSATSEDLFMPRFAMSFDVGNATNFARVIKGSRTDVLIDWMMLHALPKVAWEPYRQQIRDIAPRYLLIKCFSAGASGVSRLPQTIPGVTKHLLSDQDVIHFVGRDYRLIGSPMTWGECLRPDAHVDGIEAAERAYCFERTED